MAVKPTYEELERRVEELENEGIARKKAEGGLRKSEEKHRFFTENMAEIVWTLDSNFRTKYVSPAIEKVLGFTPEERKQQSLEEMVTPESLLVSSIAEFYVRPEERPKIVDEIIRKGFINDEFEYRRKDGQSIWVRLHTRKAKSKEAAVILEGLAEDVTELRKMAAQLRQAHKMEAIGTLAGGVAHDLNNILGGLVSYPELLLLQLPEDSPLRKPIITIQKSGEKAAAVVQDLLTLARRGVVTTEVVNLKMIIDEYLKSPEHKNLQAYHPGVHIETHLEKDTLNILGSPTHLSKTVMNLVSNAAEAMPEGGNLILSIGVASE